MPSTKTKAKPSVRNLKIQPKIRINKWGQKKVPEIRLCGNWLNAFGFTPEHRVLITASEGRLIIQLENEGDQIFP